MILMITIVSGLPRSGTSLMMQIPVAGGMSPLSDGERAADPENRRGYLEWERIKQLPNDPGCACNDATGDTSNGPGALRLPARSPSLSQGRGADEGFRTKA